jgi:hypothetical protein
MNRQMTLNANVELDTNIHNTLSPKKSDLRVLQQCFPIIPHFLNKFQMLLKVMAGAHPLSNTITSPTFLWLLTDIVGRLSNIPTWSKKATGCS